MPTLEAPTIPSPETLEDTLARLVAIVNGDAPSAASRVMHIPHFSDGEALPNVTIGQPTDAPSPLPRPTFEWWAPAGEPTGAPHRKMSVPAVGRWSVPVVAPKVSAIGIAAVRNGQRPMKTADTPNPWHEPKTAPRRAGLSPRLSLHSETFKDDENYKGMRRNSESLGRRLGRFGRKIGCLALGTAAAFSAVDALINHLSS